MTEPAIARFCDSFAALKARVNNNPRNVVWMSGESSEVQRIVAEMFAAQLELETSLATAPSKGIARVPRGFKGQLEDYKLNWVKYIGRAWCNGVLKEIENRQETAENIEGDKGQDSDRPDFDPRFENAAQLVEDILWLSDVYAENYSIFEDETSDQQRKALQAWDWFEETIGLDLKAVCERWRQIETIFIPEHVSNAYGASDPESLQELLDQAVRAYVFGASAAAMAMCRALTEHVLKHHYRCEGDTLKKIIVFAEEQPRLQWLKRLKLRTHMHTANQCLHEYRRVEEAAVLDYLRAVKTLIEKAPDSRG